MLRNKTSSSSVSSHMDLSMFKSVIMPCGSNKIKIATPTKKLFSNPFSKKSIESNEIKQTGYLSSRLERPFRFAPQIEFANNSFAAFMDLQNDEHVFSAELKSGIHALTPFSDGHPVIESLVHALEQMRSILANLEITDSVDMPIISRVPAIERSYLDYLCIYTQLSQLKKADSIDPKLAFILEGLESTLLTPFQRILEYRFFLRKVLKCEQHLCDKRGCTSKSCLTKQRMDAANEEATKRLSETIKKCYTHFNMLDNFTGLVEWEEKLNTSKCESIGQGDSKMRVDLYLTAPYKLLPHQAMAELPQIFFSETFELLPITQDLKFSARQRKEKSRMIARLNLFSDFILITAEDGVDSMLLFPPMPLSHIFLESQLVHGGSSMMITLKLSPFKMLLLEPCLKSSGEKLVQVKESLVQLALQKGQPPSKSPLNELFDNVTTSSNRFKTICRPFFWKASSDGPTDFEWCRLSKCDLIVKSVGASRVLLLIAEGTERSLLNTEISPITIYSQVSAKRLQLTVTGEDGTRKKFIIQVPSEMVLTELIEELESSIQYSLRAIFKKNRDQLVVEELPFWVGDSDDQFLRLQVKELGHHSVIMIQISCGKWVSFGAAQSFVVFAGPRNECNYYRLYLQSTINSSISFLELDIGKTSSWSSRMQGTDLILRVFRNEGYIDYYFDLKCCPDFAADLKLLGQEAQFIQEKLVDEEKRQKELKKMEEDLLRLAIIELKEEDLLAHVAPSDFPSGTCIEEAESSVSLVETIAVEHENDRAEDVAAPLDSSVTVTLKKNDRGSLKLSDSSASLTESELKNTNSKYFDAELDALTRELRARERETSRLYDQFCRLHDEKKRLLKRIK